MHRGTSTPSPIQTGMVRDCDAFYLVESGDTCTTIAADAGISLSTFYTWNPAVGSECTALLAGDYVCIDIVGYTTTVTSTPTTITSTTTTRSNGISTPTPIQTGMVTDCDSFYLVASGDTCATIASAADISLSDFYTWNPAVGTSCTSLWEGDYVCIDITGHTPTSTTTASTTTTSGNGITTPTPTQSGMVSDCDSFYLVGTDDTCATIASEEGVTVAEIEEGIPGWAARARVCGWDIIFAWG